MCNWWWCGSTIPQLKHTPAYRTRTHFQWITIQRTYSAIFVMSKCHIHSSQAKHFSFVFRCFFFFNLLICVVGTISSNISETDANDLHSPLTYSCSNGRKSYAQCEYVAGSRSRRIVGWLSSESVSNFCSHQSIRSSMISSTGRTPQSRHVQRRILDTRTHCHMANGVLIERTSPCCHIDDIICVTSFGFQMCSHFWFDDMAIAMATSLCQMRGTHTPTLIMLKTII